VIEMTHEKIRATLLFVAILAIVGSIGWAIANATQTQANTQEPKAMPKFAIQEYIRDTVVTYIKANHADATSFLNNLSWTGGRQDTKLLGAETYAWRSQGWSITIHYPVVAQPTYKITADYSQQQTPEGIGIPYRILWEGTWQNDSLTETSYSFSQ
jgi:hypothetical protein